MDQLTGPERAAAKTALRNEIERLEALCGLRHALPYEKESWSEQIADSRSALAKLEALSA